MHTAAPAPVPAAGKAARPPASGGLFYYPAEHRGRFPSIRAALAAIGCKGEPAAQAIAQARLNLSPAIALPVSFEAFPGDRFAALILPTTKGTADLWLGILEVADEDRAVAEDAARQFAEASRSKWAVFEWARQSEPLQ